MFPQFQWMLFVHLADCCRHVPKIWTFAHVVGLKTQYSPTMQCTKDLELRRKKKKRNWWGMLLLSVLKKILRTILYSLISSEILRLQFEIQCIHFILYPVQGFNSSVDLHPISHWMLSWQYSHNPGLAFFIMFLWRWFLLTFSLPGCCRASFFFFSPAHFLEWFELNHLNKCWT